MQSSDRDDATVQSSNACVPLGFYTAIGDGRVRVTDSLNVAGISAAIAPGRQQGHAGPGDDPRGQQTTRTAAVAAWPRAEPGRHRRARRSPSTSHSEPDGYFCSSSDLLRARSAVRTRLRLN